MATARILPIIVCVIALAALWTIALALWGSLPETIPLHFDLAGKPDRFGPSSWGNWLLVPIVFTALTALLAGLSLGLERLARSYPEWINVPQKARFLALDADTRARIVRPIASLLLIVPALLDLLGMYLLAGSAAVAEGRWNRLPWAPLVAVIAAVLATTLVAALGARRAIREAAAAPRAR